MTMLRAIGVAHPTALRAATLPFTGRDNAVAPYFFVFPGSLMSLNVLELDIVEFAIFFSTLRI